MNILVVDDEKNIAYAIAQILEEQKWQVTMAYDGQEGFNSLPYKATSSYPNFPI